MIKKKKYMPLDAVNWYDGWVRLQAWVFMMFFAMGTGALLVLYELMVINVQDRDMRDMYYDWRLSTYPRNIYHAAFLDAEVCCNYDPYVFNYTCASSTILTNYMSAQKLDYLRCPPTIVYTCTDLFGAECEATRSALYPLLGLNSDGSYSDCLLAGKAVVQVDLVRSDAPTTLTVMVNGQATGDQLTLLNPFDPNTTQIENFLTATIAKYHDARYVMPSVPPSQALRLNGVEAQLELTFMANAQNGWGFMPPYSNGFWPWPPMGGNCPNSSQNEIYNLQGSVEVPVPAYNPQRSSAATLSFYADVLYLPLWNVTLVDPQDSTNLNASLRLLQSLSIDFFMLATLGPCYGWMLSESSLTTTYSEVWTGPLANISSYNQTINSTAVSITLNDAARPLDPALPLYTGIIYIYSSIACGFVWMFSNGFLILFVTPLVCWNVHRNKGPLSLVYKYTRKWRGW